MCWNSVMAVPRYRALIRQGKGDKGRDVSLLVQAAVVISLSPDDIRRIYPPIYLLTKHRWSSSSDEMA